FIFLRGETESVLIIRTADYADHRCRHLNLLRIFHGVIWLLLSGRHRRVRRLACDREMQPVHGGISTGQTNIVLSRIRESEDLEYDRLIAGRAPHKAWIKRDEIVIP